MTDEYARGTITWRSIPPLWMSVSPLRPWVAVRGYGFPNLPMCYHYSLGLLWALSISRSKSPHVSILKQWQQYELVPSMQANIIYCIYTPNRPVLYTQISTVTRLPFVMQCMHLSLMMTWNVSYMLEKYIHLGCLVIRNAVIVQTSLIEFVEYIPRNMHIFLIFVVWPSTPHLSMPVFYERGSLVLFYFAFDTRLNY